VTVRVVNAPLSDVLTMIARQAGLRTFWNDRVFDTESRITLDMRNVSVEEAFTKALAGTGLKADIGGTHVEIVRDPSIPLASNGTIAGTVTDSATRKPLRGAKITIDGTDRASTGEDGTYRVTTEAGAHTLTVKLLGRSKVTRKITVKANETVSVDVSLQSSPLALDQVVVTGTVIPTQLKAVANAITVITAKELEQRGITHIDQLFRGDVPGLFALTQGSANPFNQVLMFSRGATSVRSVNGDGSLIDGTKQGTNPIKTYVDGIELADPSYLSQIDPRSIERIEILTGPQASTIYGSNALNGVMQVFTKRGTSPRPQLLVDLRTGVTQNNYSSGLAPQHNATTSVNGMEGRMSYNAGMSWDYAGSWTPGIRTTTLNGFGGARYQGGPITADASIRLTNGKNQADGSALQQYTANTQSGLYIFLQPVDNSIQRLTAQTMGVTLGYTPVNWWSQQLVVGSDATETTLTVLPVLGYVGDTVIFTNQNSTSKMSLGYTTTLHVPLTPVAQATVTIGGDEWHRLNTQAIFRGATLNGYTNIGSISATEYRFPSHNAGGFLQTQLGIYDALFLTYGLRAEWSPNYGKDQIPNLAPKYGIAYTHDVGDLTVKLRTSYGRSTRPPASFEVIGQRNTPFELSIWGPGYSSLPSPGLGPEDQRGFEGGIELYLNTRASLTVTRANQTVTNLIDYVLVDSVRSLIMNPLGYCTLYHVCASDGYWYQQLRQDLNVANIRNQSWELHGTVNLGPLATTGTYSWTKSRSLGMTPRFAAQFTAPQYQRGAAFQLVSEHTWAIGTTYATAGRTLGLHVNGASPFVNLSSQTQIDHLTPYFIRLQGDVWKMSNFQAYINRTQPIVQVDLDATQRFTSHLEGTIHVLNLGNGYETDLDAHNPVAGRQTQLGFRIR